MVPAPRPDGRSAFSDLTLSRPPQFRRLQLLLSNRSGPPCRDSGNAASALFALLSYDAAVSDLRR